MTTQPKVSDSFGSSGGIQNKINASHLKTDKTDKSENISTQTNKSQNQAEAFLNELSRQGSDISSFFKSCRGRGKRYFLSAGKNRSFQITRSFADYQANKNNSCASINEYDSEMSRSRSIIDEKDDSKATNNSHMIMDEMINQVSDHDGEKVDYNQLSPVRPINIQEELGNSLRAKMSNLDVNSCSMEDSSKEVTNF